MESDLFSLFQYPINNIIDNKVEFGAQMHQQTTTVDTWYYWEYEMFVEGLNRKNEKMRSEEEKRRKDEAKQGAMHSPNMDGLMSKAKSYYKK